MTPKWHFYTLIVVIGAGIGGLIAPISARPLFFGLFAGGGGLVVVWALTSLVSNQLFWNRRDAPDRPADATAGMRIAELRQIGGRLIARSGDRGGTFMRPVAGEVEVNAEAQTVIFRGLTFTTAFMGNRPTAEVVLRFEDILNGRVGAHQKGYWFHLRTTAGSVQFTDAIRPFESLATILLDIEELNRSNPDRYAAALKREPKVTVPWYGWAIIGAALLGLVMFASFLWNLSPR